jgi:predicted enzyme related to lactoylglutathione lyase
MAHGDITHIDIPVSDLAAGSAFYSTLFGWEIAEVPGFEGYPMWQAPNKISGGGLAPREDGFTQPRSYVEVDSIDDTAAAAVKAGGTVAMEKQQISPTSWWAVIVDPDGNEIGLYEGSTEAPEG